MEKYTVTFYLKEQNVDWNHELYREIEWEDGAIERLCVEGNQGDRDYWFAIQDNPNCVCTGERDVFLEW